MGHSDDLEQAWAGVIRAISAVAGSTLLFYPLFHGNAPLWMMAAAMVLLFPQGVAAAEAMLKPPGPHPSTDLRKVYLAEVIPDPIAAEVAKLDKLRGQTKPRPQARTSKAALEEWDERYGTALVGRYDKPYGRYPPGLSDHGLTYNTRWDECRCGAPRLEGRTFCAGCLLDGRRRMRA